MLMQIIATLILSGIAFLIGTVGSDILHWLMHHALRSKWKALRYFGSLHAVHHHFYPASLQVDDSWATKNLLYHVSVEYFTQTLVTGLCLLFMNITPVLMAWGLELLLFLIVVYHRGKDYHHRSRNEISAYQGGPFVDVNYHALHHLNPHYCYGSYIKLIDVILGTALPLKGKKIVMTGASGALGSAMKRLLSKEGAIITAFKYGLDYDYQNYQGLKEALATADILFLCHGSKSVDTQAANCDSFVALIQLFKSVRKKEIAPVEIWAVGSEIECHPTFGIKAIQAYASSKRNFAKHAHQFYRDPTIQYRHMVHSAFISKMGPGLMTANFAAIITLFLLKRGFKYIPVTYTGFAFLNYFRFLFAR